MGNISNQVIKQVVELPLERLDRLEGLIESTQNMISGALEDIGKVSTPLYLTANEYMAEIKVKRWKFNQLKDSNKIKVIQRGNKLYVPATEVRRYFEGDLEE